MKLGKYLLGLLVAPLLIACSSEVDFTYEAPEIDVDSISVGNLKRDVLTGEIASDADNVYFDFYEVSDFHGAVNYSDQEETIGLAKMGDYFKKKREINPGGTVVLSSGDMFQGSAESNLTHGYIVNYSMNIMGFEAMTVGNHEFDWNLDWLKKNQSLEVEGHKIPYLGANVYDKATGKVLDFLSPSVTITRGDYKIGIVGTLGDGAEKSIMPSLVETLEFKKEFDIAKAEAQRLRSEENCDIVIWSSHRDVDELASLGLSKEVGINAVFGGHSHNNSPAKGEEAKTVDGVPYLETKSYGKGISHARIALNKLTKETSVAKATTDVEPFATEGLVDHEEVKKVLDVYNPYIDPIKSKVIGSAEGELDVSDTFSLTNLCVDTMSLAAKKWAKENGDVKIAAAFHNANGGVRANIPAGDITFGSIYKSFPFDNEIVVVKTTGKKLKSYFAKASSYGVWVDTELTKDIDEKGEYYFATTDFMATSKSFVFKLKDEDLMFTRYVVRNTIIGRIEHQHKIHASDFTRANHDQFNLPK